MIGKALVDAVHIEAARLKENATKEELAKLDFEKLTPDSSYRCIYGQVTGDCYSRRAHALLSKCAPLMLAPGSIANATCKLNKSPKSEIPYRGPFSGDNVWSPIESYIAQEGADNDQLIRYLKGQRKTLNLTKTVNC